MAALDRLQMPGAPEVGRHSEQQSQLMVPASLPLMLWPPHDCASRSNRSGLRVRSSQTANKQAEVKLSCGGAENLAPWHLSRGHVLAVSMES